CRCDGARLGEYRLERHRSNFVSECWTGEGGITASFDLRCARKLPPSIRAEIPSISQNASHVFSRFSAQLTSSSRDMKFKCVKPFEWLLGCFGLGRERRSGNAWDVNCVTHVGS